LPLFGLANCQVKGGDVSNKRNVPEKPGRLEDQVSMLWDAVWNHIPAQLAWQDKKINFILTFVALILGLLTFLGVAFMVGK